MPLNSTSSNFTLISPFPVGSIKFSDSFNFLLLQLCQLSTLHLWSIGLEMSPVEWSIGCQQLYKKVSSGKKLNSIFYSNEKFKMGHWKSWRTPRFSERSWRVKSCTDILAECQTCWLISTNSHVVLITACVKLLWQRAERSFFTSLYCWDAPFLYLGYGYFNPRAGKL